MPAGRRVLLVILAVAFGLLVSGPAWAVGVPAHRNPAPPHASAPASGPAVPHAVRGASDLMPDDTWPDPSSSTASALIYSGTAALILSTAGILLLSRRRRLW